MDTSSKVKKIHKVDSIKSNKTFSKRELVKLIHLELMNQGNCPETILPAHLLKAFKNVTNIQPIGWSREENHHKRKIRVNGVFILY